MKRVNILFNTHIKTLLTLKVKGTSEVFIRRKIITITTITIITELKLERTAAFQDFKKRYKKSSSIKLLKEM
jgi:hypothetical protein